MVRYAIVFIFLFINGVYAQKYSDEILHLSRCENVCKNVVIDCNKAMLDYKECMKIIKKDNICKKHLRSCHDR